MADYNVLYVIDKTKSLQDLLGFEWLIIVSLMILQMLRSLQRGIKADVHYKGLFPSISWDKFWLSHGSKTYITILTYDCCNITSVLCSSHIHSSSKRLSLYSSVPSEIAGWRKLSFHGNGVMGDRRKENYNIEYDMSRSLSNPHLLCLLSKIETSIHALKFKYQIIAW